MSIHDWYMTKEDETIHGNEWKTIHEWNDIWDWMKVQSWIMNHKQDWIIWEGCVVQNVLAEHRWLLMNERWESIILGREESSLIDLYRSI